MCISALLDYLFSLFNIFPRQDVIFNEVAFFFQKKRPRSLLLSNLENSYDTSGGHIAGDRSRRRLSFVSFFFDKILKSTSTSSKDREAREEWT